MLDEKGFQERIQGIENLVQEIEQMGDVGARASVQELVASIMDLHAAGLGLLIDILKKAGQGGQSVLDEFALSRIGSGLLLLHGLHPEDLRTRVTKALDRVRPFLLSQGANVELVGETDGVVRLLLRRSGGGCSSTATTLRAAVEEAVYEAAPDMIELEIEEPVHVASPSGLVQLRARDRAAQAVET